MEKTEFQSKLIDLVRQNQILYDMSRSKYKEHSLGFAQALTRAKSEIRIARCFRLMEAAGELLLQSISFFGSYCDCTVQNTTTG